MVLPCCSDGCNSSPRLALSRIVSGRCCLVVQMDAAVFPYLCVRRKLDFLLNSDECPNVLPWRTDGCNLELFESSRHWWASGCMIGPSGWKLGIRLLWLGICTESSFEHLEPLLWNGESEINGIPDYVAALYKSDFVKQNAANHKLTN